MRAGWLFFIAVATFGCGGAAFTDASGSGDDGGMSPTDATLSNDGTAPPNDGGQTTPDSGRRDGAARDSSMSDSSDASTTDAADAGDATLDAANGGDADDGATPAFTTCAAALTEPTFVFCSDFDPEDGDSGPPWNWAPPALATSKAMNAVDTTDFVSPPNGYIATTQLLLPTDSANFASLGQPISTTKPHVTYAFDVYVKQFDTSVSLLDASGSVSFPIAQIVVGAEGAANRLFVDLVLSASGLAIEQSVAEIDGGEATQTNSVTGTLGASWTHVEIDLDRAVAPSSVTVRLNGVIQGGAPTLVPATSSALQVGLGIILLVPPSGMNAVVFDNAIVHAHN